MGIWKDLGAPADIIALADQVESKTKDELRKLIRAYSKLQEGPDGPMPLYVTAYGFMHECLQDTTNDTLNNLSLLFAAALHRLFELESRGGQ